MHKEELNVARTASSYKLGCVWNFEKQREKSDGKREKGKGEKSDGNQVSYFSLPDFYLFIFHTIEDCRFTSTPSQVVLFFFF